MMWIMIEIGDVVGEVERRPAKFDVCKSFPTRPERANLILNY